MQNKGIVAQAVYAIICALIGALFMFMLLGAINQTYAQEPLDDCHKECAVSIPWCYNWSWKGCTKWGTKCLEHKLVCELPDPTPTPTPSPQPSVEPSPIPCEQTEEGCPIPSVTPSPVPLSEAHGCRDNCQPKYEPILCHGENPPQVQFSVTRTSPTSVQLNWWAITGVDHYSVLYGYKSENEMGIPFVKPDATQIDINGLKANQYINVRMMAEYPNKCVSWSTTIDP